MMIILKANKVNLFVSSVLIVFWYHSPNILDTPHICNISRLRVKPGNVEGLLQTINPKLKYSKKYPSDEITTMK
jgi:hypothetical protein